MLILNIFKCFPKNETSLTRHYKNSNLKGLCYLKSKKKTFAVSCKLFQCQGPNSGPNSPIIIYIGLDEFYPQRALSTVKLRISNKM